MPIEFTIDVDRRLVISKALGTLTFDEMLDYQQHVWSRLEVAGFNELIDMSAVEKIHEPFAAHIQQLATLSAAMDTGTPAAKFAIVAPEQIGRAHV